MIISSLLEVVISIADLFYLFFMYLGKLAFTPIGDLIADGFALSVVSPFLGTVFSTPSFIGPAIQKPLLLILDYLNLSTLSFFHFTLYIVCIFFAIIVLLRILNIVTDSLT